MKISENTLKNLFDAIKKIGEDKVNDILNMFTKKNIIIDKLVNICCEKYGIEKNKLFEKRCRARHCYLVSIIYILKNNGFTTSDIENYFNHEDIKVAKRYKYAHKLDEKIPYERDLKIMITDLENLTKNLFLKYTATI